MTGSFLRLLNATSRAALVALAFSPISANASLIHDIWITSIDEPNGNGFTDTYGTSNTYGTNGPLVDLHGQITLLNEVGGPATGVISGTVFGHSLTLCTPGVDPALCGSNPDSIDFLLQDVPPADDWLYIVDLFFLSIPFVTEDGVLSINPLDPLLYDEFTGYSVTGFWEITGQNSVYINNLIEVEMTAAPVHVPEPTILALLSLGLVGLGFTRRRMKA